MVPFVHLQAHSKMWSILEILFFSETHDILERELSLVASYHWALCSDMRLRGPIGFGVSYGGVACLVRDSL
jgi:hypothetical protein